LLIDVMGPALALALEKATVHRVNVFTERLGNVGVKMCDVGKSLNVTR